MTKHRTPERAAPAPPRTDIPVVVLDALIHVLAVDAAEVTLDSALREDLGADSMDITELAMDFEALGLAIEFDHVDRWVRVRDVVRTVEALTKKAARHADPS